MKKGCCYSLLFLLSFIFPAKAQPILQLGMYDSDIGDSLNFQVSGRDNNSLVGYSWAVEDSWLVKCSYRSILVEEVAFAVGEYDYSAWQGSLITEYYFNINSMALPYLGIEVGWRRTKFGSVRESGLFIGSKVGIKFFLNDSVSIDSSISYKFSPDDVFVVDFKTTDGNFYPGIALHANF